MLLNAGLVTFTTCNYPFVTWSLAASAYPAHPHQQENSVPLAIGNARSKGMRLLTKMIRRRSGPRRASPSTAWQRCSCGAKALDGGVVLPCKSGKEAINVRVRTRLNIRGAAGLEWHHWLSQRRASIIDYSPHYSTEYCERSSAWFLFLDPHHAKSISEPALGVLFSERRDH